MMRFPQEDVTFARRIKLLERVFRPNPGDPRSLAEAVALARSRGVTIGDDVLIPIDPVLGTRDFARYATTDCSA
jgi:hypothetical protein